MMTMMKMIIMFNEENDEDDNNVTILHIQLYTSLSKGSVQLASLLPKLNVND